MIAFLGFSLFSSVKEFLLLSLFDSPLCCAVASQFFKLCLLLLLSVEVFFHVLNSFLVERAFDFGGLLEVVKVPEEFQELVSTLFDVVDGNMAVLVEVKTHPVIADQHCHILVVASEIFLNALLVLQKNLHQEGEHVGRAVIDHVQVAAQRSVYIVIQEAIELHLPFFYLFFKALNALLYLLVRCRLLHKFNTKLASVQTNVNQLKTQLLQFLFFVKLYVIRNIFMRSR